MSHRNFTVFQDAPPVDMRKTRSVTMAEKLASSISTTSAISLNRLASAEKENLHPVTGERAGSGHNKKRKTTVLATKSQMPLKQKDSEESKPVSKKRKSASTKGKSSAKKDDGASKTGRKSSKKPSRKGSPLPVVAEVSGSQRESERALLAAIDSRCYDLTVQPLADVTEAYDHDFIVLGSVAPSVADEKDKLRTVKEPSCEPEIRDYLSPPLAGPVPSLKRDQTPQEVKTFSTPERKSIYAAFTFSSPSPSAERFSRAQSTGSATPRASPTLCLTSIASHSC